MLAALLRRLDDDPASTGRQLSYGRMAVGSAFLVAPRVLWGRQVKSSKGLDNAVLPLRMAGVRDLMLALGAVFATRRNSAALRGWLEAAAIADAADAVLFSTNRSLRAAPRWTSAVVAAAAAVAGMRAARRL